MIIDAGHQCAPEQAKVGGGEDGKYDTKKQSNNNILDTF